MAKRFIDTKIWDKQWFRKLTARKKLLWLYIITKCDHAGIRDADFEAASFFIGETVSKKDLDFMIDKVVCIKSKNGQEQLFVPPFIDYQYGYLKETSKPHLSVRKRLIEKNLQDHINKGLEKNSKSIVTPKAKAKDKDKLKDREKDFRIDVFKIADELKINKKIANDFFLFWSETKPNGRKMKKELQQTFDIRRRLQRWINNDWNNYKKETNVREKMSITGS